VDTVAVSPPEVTVTAANGIRWRRLPGSSSSAEEFLAALDGLGGDRSAREWSLWREGEPRREDDRLHEVLFQREHADPPSGSYLTAGELEARFEARWAETQRQLEVQVAAYDRDRAMARLKLLSTQADAGFIRHVLGNPASDASGTRPRSSWPSPGRRSRRWRLRWATPMPSRTSTATCRRRDAGTTSTRT
jgi:hypothetical protein